MKTEAAKRAAAKWNAKNPDSPANARIDTQLENMREMNFRRNA